MTLKDAGKTVKTTAVAAVCAASAFLAASNYAGSDHKTAPVPEQYKAVADMAMSAGY